MGAAGALCIRHDVSAPGTFTRGRPYMSAGRVDIPAGHLATTRPARATPEMLVGAGSST